MNKSYRIVWNKARNCLMVVAEFASSQGKGKSVGGAVIGAVAAAVMALGAAGDAEATSSSTTVSLGAGQSLSVGATEKVTVSGSDAVVVTGAGAGSIAVNGGTISSTQNGIFLNTNASLLSGVTVSTRVSGGLTYTGSVSGQQAIYLLTDSTLAGGVSNTGQMNGSFNAIAAIKATITGGISNAVQTGVNGASIGTISGGSRGLYLNSSFLSGGITNAGLISGSSQAAISIIGPSVVDNISNLFAGSIGGRAGILLYSGARISGFVSNAGTITGAVNTGDGALMLNASTISGNVFNSGRMFAQGAVQLVNAQITGSFTNTGVIDSVGAPAPGDAINLQDSHLLNGFNNTGLVRGAQSGIQLVGSSIAGGFNNIGNIQGNAGAAIAMTNSTLTGGVNNTAGTIYGVSGIHLVNSATAVAISNTGVIAASATSGSAISVSGGQKATLANVAGTVIGALNGNMDVSNSGLIALQQASGTNTVTGSHVNASISGNYEQATAGMLQIGVTGTAGTGTTSGNFSILNVAGSATFAANSKLRVNLNQAGAVQTGQTIAGVVTASSLSTNGFTITDNLAGINFSYATTAGSLSLIAIASTVNCGATVSGNNLGTCEVAINNPNLYIDPTGKVGTTSGAINSVGIAVLSGNIAGRIYNRGTVVGSTSAIHFTSGATLTGGLTNAGLISGVSGTAISMAPGVLGGGLTNQRGGTIQGALDAINLNQTSIAGGLNNSGLISGAFTAINANGATISGGLNNSIGGVISAPVAIQGINSNISGINNSGFIVGTGNTGTAITASGAAVTLNNAQYGQVYGGLQGTINISNSGVIALQSVSGLSMVAGSHFNGSIAGNFVESSTGALILGVAGTTGSGTTAGNFSVLTVGGSVSLASGSKVKLDLSSTTAITAGQTISNLITAAGGVTNNGVQIIGNSAKLDFTAITTAGGLSAAATQRSAASYSNTVTGAQTVTSYVAFDNPSLTVSGTISGVNQGVVVLSAGPTAVGRIYNNNGRILANQTGIYLSSGATVTAGITNAGVVSGASNYGIYLNAALLQGGLTNSNFITSAGIAGVALVHSSLSGGINNSSTIQGGNTGIRLSVSTLVGGLANSGLINGTTNAGVALFASTLGGGLTNNGGKQINGYTAGVRIASGSTVSGAINNSGVMSGGTASGAGFVLSQAYLASGLSNNAAGVISGRTGVRLANGSAINGPLQSAFTNSGAIRGTSGAALSITGNVALYYNTTATGEFINVGTLSGQTGMAFNNATLTGAVTNNGFIQATVAGILLSGSTLNNGLNTIGSISAQTGVRLVNSTVAGVLRNSGTISATNAAMSIGGGVSINITNTGMLSGQTGINVASAVLNGSLTNTGLITAAGSAFIVSASTLAGTVFNGTNGTLSGQTGLRVANSAINGAISNTGLITGAGAGLSIVGTVDVSGGFVNAGTITGTAKAISLSNATMTGANGFTNQGLIYAASNNAITASGGTNTALMNQGGTIIGAINGALSVINTGGVVSLTSFGGTIGSHLSASIAGAYSQGVNSVLVMGVDGVSGSGALGGNFSTLAAGGIVNLNNSVINVQQNRGNAVLQGQTLASFIMGSSVATNNLTIVDNIKSIYYTFTGAAGVLSLVAVASGADCGPTLSGASGPCQVTVPNPDLYIASTGQISSTIQGLYIISAAGSAEGRVLNAGTISANQTGVFFTSGANLAGGFTNTGLISGGNGYGILMTASGMGGFANLGGTVVGAVNVSYSTISGGITNTGQMDGLQLGTAVYDGSSGSYSGTAGSLLSGNLINSGFIGSIVIAASTINGNVVNQSSGFVNGEVRIVNSFVSNGIANTGSISPQNVAGISVLNSTVTGGLSNSGSISTQSSIDGLQIGNIYGQSTPANGSQLVGSIVNTGYIDVGSVGVGVYASSVTGSIINSGTIVNSAYGIRILSSSIGGDIINSGSVQVGEPTPLQIKNSTIAGRILNSGTMGGGYSNLVSNSHVASGITNTGQISVRSELISSVIDGVTNSGSFSGGLVVGQSTISSGVYNTGFIAGLKLGYYSSPSTQQNAGTISGGVVNSGLIQASYAPAFIVNGATITGGFANSGTISGASYGGGGASILNTTLVGGITNSGQILGTASLAALTINGSTISGGFNNTVGTIVGRTGIQLTNATITGGFNNGGLISGLNGVAMVATGLPSTLTVQNAQSGLIVGAVTGDFEVSNSGVLALQTLSGIGGSIVAGSHVNATIAGNYIQSGTGALRIGATGATAGSYSQMNVSSIASFAPGGQIIVNTNNLTAFNANDTLTVVTISGAGSLTVSGLSVIDNTPYVSFEWSTATGSLQLIAYSTAACGSVTGQAVAPCEISTVAGYTFVNVFNGGTIVPSLAPSRVGAPGIAVISGAPVNGYINNAGLVLSNNTGIAFYSGSNLQGGVTNTGLVVGTVAAGFAMTAGILQGGLSNAGGTFSGGQSGFNLVNASISGGVTNTGLIQGLTNAGVAMYSTVVDSFRNTGGTIVGNNIGMVLSNSTVTGGLSNTGLIRGSVAGVLLGAGTNVTLSNLAGGSIVGVTGAGVSVSGATSATINNLGYISSVNNAGSLNTLVNAGSIGGFVNQGGVVVAGINNAGGTISTANSALLLNAGTVNSGITNSGLVSASSGTAVLLTDARLTGGLTNLSGGRIAGGSKGLMLQNNTTVVGNIVNSGVISGAGTPGTYGLVMHYDNTGALRSPLLVGSLINNAGATINGYSAAIHLARYATITGDVVNSGVMTANNFGGLYVAGGNVNIQGSVVNSATGTMSGGYFAVSLGSMALGNGLTNAGLLTSSGTALEIYQATVGTSIVNTGTITGAKGIALSTVSLNGVVSNSGLIYGTSGVAISAAGSSVTVVNNASGSVVGAINGTANVSNSGLIALQSAYNGTTFTGSPVSATITGNYVQAASGTLQLGVTSSGAGSGSTSGNYSNLGVGGSASFAANSKINVIMSSTNSVIAGQTLAGVVSATGGLSSAGFSIIDNSTLVDFVWRTTSGALMLVAVTPSVTCAATITGAQQGACEVGLGLPNLTINSLGTISGASQGIKVLSATSTAIMNLGSVIGSVSAIQFLTNGTLTGGITNAGLISGASGIVLGAGAYAQSITNNAGGSIVGSAGAGISVAGTATAGQIQNSGYVSSINNSGSIDGIVVVGGSIASGVTNTGTLNGEYGLYIAAGSVAGGFNNAGNVGTTTGVAGVAIGNNGRLTGGLNNTGTIVSYYGVHVATGGQLVGGLTNSGSIIGAVTNRAIAISGNGTIGGTISGGLNNTGLITARSAIAVSSGNLAGGITNSGSIVGGSGTISGYGLMVANGTVAGISNAGYVSSIGLTNGGLITGINNASGRIGGIIGLGGSVTNGVTNGGTISGYRGISLASGAEIQGGINNIGRLQGDSAALMIGATSSVSGGLTNSGQIVGNTYFGAAIYGVLTGGIQNTGSIIGTSAPALLVSNFATVIGNINNAGLVATGNTTISAIAISAALIQGGINNTTTGTISGGPAAITLWATRLVNGLTNAGLITATGSAFFDQNASSITGGLANLGGTISGGQWGINLLGTSMTGVLNNTGLIDGATVGGINIVAGANLQDGLSNSGTIGGAIGINVGINATINGLANSGSISSINNIGVINRISQAAGEITNGITNTGLIMGVSGVAVEIAGTATTLANTAGTIVGAVNGLLDVSNSGLIALQSAYNGSTFAGSPVSATITGNYFQAANGTLQLGVNGTTGTGTIGGNYSTLNVTGTASFAASSVLNVVMSSADSVVAGQTLAGVVSAGSLTSNGFSILDNSALIGFRYQTVSGALNLVAFNTPNCGSVVGTAQVGPCEVGVGIPSLTVTGLGTISGGTQGINVLAANLTGRIINQGTVQGNETGIRFMAGGVLSSGLTNTGLIEGLLTHGIVMNQASLGGGISNNAGGSMSGVQNGVMLSGSTLSGGIANAGIIAGTSFAGVLITNSGVIAASGAFSNQSTGTVSGDDFAVFFGASTLSGGFTNAGLLVGNVGLGFALGIDASEISGGLVNTGKIQGDGAGAISLAFATVTGGFVNSGIVSGKFSISPISLIAGGFTNSGLLSGDTALYMKNGGVITGGLTNTGSIIGTAISGINVMNGSSIAGGLYNSRLIRGQSIGLLLAGGNVIGGISNTGSIIGVTGYGISLSTNAVMTGTLRNDQGYITGINNAGSMGGIQNYTGLIAGGINNSGTIANEALSVFMYHGTLTGGLTNSGVIQATSSFAGMQLYASNLTGDLANLGGTILGGLGGSAALSLYSGTTVTGVLSNTGMISGQVGVELYASQVAGGITNSGSIVGTSGAGLEVGANTTLSGLNNTGYISSVSNAGFIATINNVGGTIAGGVTNAGLIYNASGSSITASGSTLTVANIASGTLAGAFGGDLSISNSGLIALQTMAGGTISAGTSLSASITGNYVQATAGTLQFGVNGLSGTGTIAGNYSTLSVSGSATFAANSKLKVSMSSATAVQNGQTLAGVLTAGSLTTNGFSITDNSALVDFSYATVGGVLSLIATAPTTVACGTVSSSVQGPCLMAFNAPNVLVTGLGTISGGSTGVRVLSGSIVGGIVNQGSVIGASYGVAVNQGATTITGSLSNAGLIQGGVAGVYLSNTSISGGLSNASTGTITGTTGLTVLAGSLLAGGLTNTGLITGVSTNSLGLSLAGNLIGGLNNSGGTISGALMGIYQVGGTLTGGLSNTGVITGITGTGMFMGAANLQGGLSNLGGSITGGNTGVLVSASTIAGAFSNTGLIQGISTAGLALAAGSTLSGVLNNTTSGTIAGHTGLQVVGSSLASGLNNGGLITGTTAAGVSLSNAIIGGSITNNGGTMSGAQNGLAIYNGTTVSGNVSNSGYLQATTYAGLSLGQSYITGSVINQSGASITGYYGMNANGATVAGGVSNAGLVQGTYSGLSLVNASVTNGVNNLSGGSITGGTLGMFVSAAQIAGGLNNAVNATISGASFGLQVTAGGVIGGGVTNAGLITGPSGVGVGVAGASTIAGGLLNLALATISGGVTGLAVSANSVVSGGLTNAGLITGGTYAINAPGLTSIVTNGTNAQFVGTVSAVNASLNVSSGTLSAANGIVVNSVSVASGSVLNLVTSNSSTVSGGITATNGVTNAGVVNVGMSQATVTGSYAQTAGGVLQIGALGSNNHGSLNVTGLATFAPNASIYITTITGATFANGSTLGGLVNAGSLSATTFSVTSNSSLLSFTATVVGNSVGVTAQTVNNNSIPAAVASQGNTAGAGAAGSLNTVFNSFVAGSTTYASMNNAMAAFANMSSNAQISQAVSQSLPVLSSNSPVQTLAVLTAINQSIEARSLKLRGVSSGHEMYGNNNVWMKPFGSWMNQGNMNGAYGFKANAGGLMLGADHQWDDKARVGGAFAWGNSSANSNMGGQNQTSNMYQFVGYGAYAVTPSVNVNMQANGGWNNNTTNRNIGFLGTSAQASYDSAVWHAGVGVDRPTKLSEDTTFIPQARFDYTWIKNQGYSETGAAYGMGLNVGSQTYQTSVLGVDGKVQHKIGDHHMVSTNLGVGYNFSPTQTWVAASYQGASALQFTTTGVNPSAVSGRAGLGYTYKVKEGVDVGVRYDIDVQEQYTNQIATAKARWNF